MSTTDPLFMHVRIGVHTGNGVTMQASPETSVVNSLSLTGAKVSATNSPLRQADNAAHHSQPIAVRWQACHTEAEQPRSVAHGCCAGRYFMQVSCLAHYRE
ncbi:hypothetical protein V7S43_015600 [Phytophthora oleae]|uniref:Guanylate cyclase domain-containing protein n=1 Tax=Phytophthora oleae TaxID=2107226 RepID=A0ABD3F2G6_9STRA